MTKNEVLVKGINVRYKSVEKEDYISLTDMAKAKNSKDPRFTVYSWLRNKETLLKPNRIVSVSWNLDLLFSSTKHLRYNPKCTIICALFF